MTVTAGERESVSRAVFWSPATPIRAIPERLLVQPSAGGATATLRLRATEPFEVFRVESDAAWLTVGAVVSGEAFEHSFKVQASPAGDASAVRAVLTVHCNHPGQPAVHVPVISLGRSTSHSTSD